MGLDLPPVAPAFGDIGCDWCCAHVAGRIAAVLFVFGVQQYKVVPNATVAAKHALFGGFLSAAVFKLAFELFAWFSGYLVYDAIYGVLAALPVFLLWLYVVWVIVLMGALFVCSYSATDFDQN